MKILFLNLYSGQVERGAESFVHQLADRLSKNHQVTFIKGSSTTIPIHQFAGTFISKLRKRLFIDKPALEVLLFSLAQISNLLSSSYDIVIPLNGFWQLLILKLLQPFKGYKIIVTGHSGPGWDERFNLYLHPNYFVATTGPTLAWAQKTCPWTKSVLISYAYEVVPSPFTKGGDGGGSYEVVSPLFTKEGARGSSPLILLPSALVPYKRVDLAIKAVAKLKKASLLVLGKGQLEKELQSLGCKLLGNRFHLTSVPYRQMPSIYQAARIVTLPSHPQENSPMVFLEALTWGKMIVATNSPRNRWMLEDSAIFVDPTNINQYSDALSKALKAKPNTKPALKKFTWKKVLSQYEKLFSN